MFKTKIILIYIDQYKTDKENLENTTEDVNKKITDTSGLVATIALNKKLLKLRTRDQILIV